MIGIVGEVMYSNQNMPAQNRNCPMCSPGVYGPAAPPEAATATTRTLLVPLIGDIWSLIVGTLALIKGRRRV